MSDRKNDPMDLLGSRLDAAFARSDAAASSRRRRWRRPAVALAAAALIAALAWIGSERLGENEVFTVDEAVAEVASKNFDRPAVQPSRYRYENSTSEWIFGYGTVFKTKSLSTRVLSKLQSERWSKPNKGGWIRTTDFPGKFLTERDREIAIELRDQQQRMAQKMLRERRARGDRRPVPRDFLFGLYPIDAALRTPPPPPRTTICRFPAWYQYLSDTSNPSGSLPDPADIPDSAKAVLKLLQRETRSFSSSISRTGWLWTTIDSYLGGDGEQLTAKQRAALVGAIGLLPGVTTNGPGPDPDGRDSIGFFRTERGVKYSIYFDTETGLPIHTSGVVVAPSRSRFPEVPKGTVVQRTVLHDFKYVDAPPTLEESKPPPSPADFSVCQMFRGNTGRQMKKRALRIKKRIEERERR